jgi:DNA-binding NarL/FixJ family response regulator
MDRMLDGIGPQASWIRNFRYEPKPTMLSGVQWLIAQLVSCGLSGKEIAFMLRISASTVKVHNNNTLRGLGSVRRGQLVRYIFLRAVSLTLNWR